MVAEQDGYLSDLPQVYFVDGTSVTVSTTRVDRVVHVGVPVCVTASHCIAAGWATNGAVESPTVAVTTDAGAHWSTSTQSSMIGLLFGISCPTPPRRVASPRASSPRARRQPAQGNDFYPFLERTVDGGVTWHLQHVVTNNFGLSLVFGTITCGSAARCVASGSGLTEVTQDAGVHWRLRGGGEDNFAVVACPTATTCLFANGGAGMLRSVDGGG